VIAGRLTGTWEEVVARRAGWEECLQVARRFSDHYSMTEDQQEYVYRYAMLVPPGGVAVELGTCNGKTSAILAYCAKARGFEAHGVDAFILESSPDEVKRRMAEAGLPFTLHYGLTSRIRLPEGYGIRALVEWDRPIDLLIVDANHIAPYVGADCDRWVPLLTLGGVAMFHDYDARPDPRSPHDPVRLAVDRTTAEWQMEYYIAGLMIKRRIE